MLWKKLRVGVSIMAALYPSLISGDLLNLERDIKKLEPFCNGFHLDVMDFHFAPNLTWGPDFINAIRSATQSQLWVHLMVDRPADYLERLKLHEGDIVSVHYETLANNEIERIWRHLKHNGLKRSLAINPETAIEVVKTFFHELDQVLLMSVEPGFSGQSFLPESYKRLQELKDLRDEHSQVFRIGIDGGISEDNIRAVIAYGADDIAMASGIFDNPDPIATLKRLNQL
jgi:ribulose-phosphate 3-epimerase